MRGLSYHRLEQESELALQGILRDLEEIMAVRDVIVGHATLNRWMILYAAQIAEEACRRKQTADRFRRLDGIYFRVKGQWVYLPAVVTAKRTLDFMSSKRRNGPAASKSPARAMEADCRPRKIVIDKSAADTQGITDVYRMLKRLGCVARIEMVRIKSLDHMVKQEHSFIRRRAKPMLGFKSFASAASTVSSW